MKEIPVENCHECLFLLMVYCRVYDRKLDVEDIMQYRKPGWCKVVSIRAIYEENDPTQVGPPKN